MSNGIRNSFILFPTPQASAPTGTNITGTDRLWINSSNHHVMFTDSSNVDHDLSAGASGMSIGGAISGGTDKSVLFDSGGNLAQDNASFQYDSTNHVLTLKVNDTTGLKVPLVLDNVASTVSAETGIGFGVGGVSVGNLLAWPRALASGLVQGINLDVPTGNAVGVRVNSNNIATVDTNGLTLASGKSILGTYNIAGTPTLTANVTANGFLGPTYGGTSTNVSAPSWTAPTLLNSWVNFGGAVTTAGYFKDALGYVHLKGTVKSGTTAGATVFTLPAGFRPLETWQFNAYPSSNVCQVDSSGNVFFSGGSTTAQVMDGFSFPAQQ